MPLEKTFVSLELQSSIVFDKDNIDAVDRSAPLSFLDWVQYFTGTSTDPKFLLNEYKNYVKQWFAVKQVQEAQQEDYIRNLYISLFRNIAVNLLTTQERRFIETVDLTQDVNISIVLPIFVRKIKDICLYFSSLRENAKSAVYQHNIRGSGYSIKKAIVDELNNSFIIPEINRLFRNNGVTQDTLKTRVEIDVDELIDTETSYFDINPTLPASAYDATTARGSAFAAESYEFSPELFIDFEKSVVTEIKKYPVVLQQLGNNFSVNLDFTSDDLQFLKDRDFTDLVNNLEKTNLNITSLRDALKHFSGTTFYYLSSDSDRNFQTGKLFEAREFENYLNRRFPTVIYTQSDKLVEESAVGRFFRPSKTGIQNFISFELAGSIKDIEPNKIYIFPDPQKYGNISGLSRSSFDNPFSYDENVESVKVQNTNTFIFGEAISDYLTKFRGYQSKSETLNTDPVGISRSTDAVEFFSGELKNVWSNEDVFSRIPANFLPIQSRQEMLLVDNFKTLYQSKQDIFGNEFALFKALRAQESPQAFYDNNQEAVKTLIELDGQTFFNMSSGGFNPNIEYTFNTTALSTSAFDYFLPCIRFYPELDFYKATAIFYNTILDCYQFDLSSNTFTVLVSTIDLVAGFTAGTTLSAQILDCGVFQNLFVDLPSNYIDRHYYEDNTLVGNTLSTASTQLCAASSSLTEDISLYWEHFQFGDFYFRDYAGTVVEPVSTILSSFFIKYPAAIKSELETKVRNFDIIYDTIVIETENYIVFETLKFDFNTNLYIRTPEVYNYTQKGSVSAFEFFSNTWFDETKREIYYTTTNLLSTLSSTNNKIIFPRIYRFDFNQITQIWPLSAETFNMLNVFSLSGTSLSSINFVEIERPLLSYGKDTGKFILRYIAKDTSNLFYEIKVTFKISDAIYDFKVEAFRADMYLHSENFGNSAFSDDVFMLDLSQYDNSIESITNNLLTL